VVRPPRFLFAATLAALFACAGPSFSTALQPTPIEAFYQRDTFTALKLSPDGRHLAAGVPLEDKTVLVIFERASMKVTGRLAFESQAHVEWFDWANNEYVVATASKREGRLAQPTMLSGLYRLNVDGTDQGEIVSGGPQLLSLLPADDENILVQFPGDQGVAKVRITNGAVRRQSVSIPTGTTRISVDNAGVARLALTSRATERESRLYLSKDEGRTWTLLSNGNETRQNSSILGYSSDNTAAFLATEQAVGPDVVERLDLATGQRSVVLADDNVSPDSVLASLVDGGVYGIGFLDGRPRFELLQPDHPEAKARALMQAAFPDATVVAVSGTADAAAIIYAVYSDTINGDYYLWDRATGQATAIASRSPHLDPASLATTEPLRFKARDGLEIEAFLTRPRGAQGALPMVVLVHGGPIGIFDRWGFDSEVQLLASRGYAVLRVNFRGSGNYGRSFQVAGFGEWGGKMQDDVTDATRYAIEQGHADPERICLYGASYGAYSALMGVVMEPAAYRCAIGAVGVYSLPRLLSDGWATNWVFEDYLEDMIGVHALDRRSPNLRAADIRVPVLLSAGEMDRVAPPVHTRELERAIRSAGGKVEMVIYEREAHGNYLIANQVDWGRRVLRFLDAHIGASAAGQAAE